LWCGRFNHNKSLTAFAHSPASSGSAEIFGAELAVQKAYTFSDVKLAAFTWYGAQIETAGIDGVRRSAPF
jgi:hypothetical protein